MDEFNKILWIGYFEAKAIVRSNVFKIFCLLQMLVLLLVAYIFQGNGKIQSFPSAIPYLFITYLNIVQEVSIIFITAHLFGEDKKYNAKLSLYPRPFSNIGYVLGKFFGAASVFVLISLIFTFFVFLYHFFLLETPVKYSTYLLYPLILFLPTILFTAGLTAFITLLLRSEIISITFLMCLFALVFPAFGSQYPFLWDITGKNLPMLSSDFVGFGNLPILFLQRRIFILGGIGFVFVSGLIFRFYRQPQSLPINLSSFAVATICFAAAFVSGHEYLTVQYGGRDLRSKMRVLENSITDQPYLSMTTCNLELIHKKDKIEVKSAITIENKSQIASDIYRFRLNPGLEVLSVENNGKPAEFERNIHIINLKPSMPLQPGEKDSLVISYRGRIDENACYTDIDESDHEKNNSNYSLIIDKRYSFITPDYVLLTQENRWYPTPFTTFSNSVFNSGKRDFTKFNLNVTTDSSLTAISQGESVKTAPGKFIFIPEQPLTQLSLIIGDYEKHATVMDGVEYAFYAETGHDYISGLEALSNKKLHEAITDLKREYETFMISEYPFKRLSAVEVPIQFLSQQRDYKLSSEISQPEQIFVPEKGLMISPWTSVNYKKKFKRLRNYNENKLKTDEELQYKMFYDSIYRVFLTETTERKMLGLRDQIRKSSSIVSNSVFPRYSPSFIYDYNISPNYYYLANCICSDNYPLMDIAMSYFFKSKEIRSEFRGSNFHDLQNNSLIVKKLLQKYSLEELLKKPDIKYFIFYVLRSKSESLFATIKAQTGLTDQEFDDFLESYLKSHRFENVSAESFCDTLKTSFNTDLTKYFTEWQDGNLFPKFEIHNPVLTYFTKDNYRVNHYNLTICNSGETAGTILISIGDYEHGTRRHIYLEKNQAKEISLVLYDFPDSLNVVGTVTYNAYNPRFSDIRFKKQRFTNYTVPFEGERIVEFTPKPSSPDTIIVDDTSEGFKIVKQTNEGYLKKLINPYKEDELDFSSFNIKNIPVRWTDIDGEHFYGVNEGSVHCKKSGKGDTKVCWDANLPSAGEYDVYYYTPSLRDLQIPNPFRDIYVVDDFHFFINSENGVEETIFNFKDAKEGWNYLGNYRFSMDNAHVELTDKSKGDMVYADAVKFVRK